MPRFHMHITVNDIDTATRYYSALFGLPPAVAKPDYAKWMIEEPAINFAISHHEGAKSGIDHIGFQANDPGELEALNQRLASADIATRPQPDSECCYAKSSKYWAKDPDGIVWELFHTMDNIETYGRALPAQGTRPPSGACCG